MTDESLHILGGIEAAEARLLAWGLVDGGFTEDELLAQIAAEAQAVNLSETPDALLDDLLARRLLIPAPENSRLYRTRMAETIRLMAHLRQLFPKHRGSAWRTAPRLVADFRFHLQPRRYPTRQMTPSACVEALEQGVAGLSPQTLAAARALLDGRGDGFALSTFQLDAARSIFTGLDSGETGGTMVSAGTGSGKTLAFYLPVLSSIAGRLAPGPQAVAIYPRNELLKDQFSQTYLEARRLDGHTVSGSKITTAAFFGNTPGSTRESDRALERKGWTRHGEARACPYLRCPRPGCAGPLVWPDAKRNEGIEELACSDPRCDARVRPDEVMLTRERMRATPPDVLFTTTEMLNRNLSSWEYSRLLGIEGNGPRVALIDEAHTYTGIHGAQVALLVRRWHSAVGGRVHFVGLSATLADAADFLARLTGLRDHEVTLVEPGEFEEEGMEYKLILRGDPASGTSLLSTTIQAAMLLRRALDTRESKRSRGGYGSKVFVFTDDLDVTNRLYHDMRDAEALGNYGNQRRSGATPLAALRSPDGDDLEARRADGQVWDLATEIGHDLSGETVQTVTRVSSQDAGVNDRSDVIVATASLEVGFNDVEVGGVMQHKAPLSEAAFVQRQGRAGRTRDMRPWTVVTLDDFGRDRLAYDAYDTLFDPVLKPRPLPISNRAVLHMQATYSWFDWVARRLAPTQNRSSVWLLLSGPYYGDAAQREAIISLIEETLEHSGTLADLKAHLRRALSLTEDQVQSVLWEPPRALMTTVLPTALRRLRSRWFHSTRDGGGPGRDFHSRFDPLPDFVPAALFGELSLPEVLVTTPPQNKNAREDVHQVAILQAMRTLAPGNVSHRFAIEHSGARSWVEPPGTKGDCEIRSSITRHEPIGSFAYVEDDAVTDIECLRPWEMKASVVPKDVADSSSGRLDWRSQIAEGDAPHEIQTPKSSHWSQIFPSLVFHTHNRHGPAVVRRFATGGSYVTVWRTGDEEVGTYTFSDANAPAAVGFELDADGLCTRPRLPERVLPVDTNGEAMRALRSAMFADRVATDGRLTGIANFFKRAQLETAYLSALVDRALRTATSLRAACQELHDGNAAAELVETVRALLASGLPVSPGEDEAEDSRGATALIETRRKPDGDLGAKGHRADVVGRTRRELGEVGATACFRHARVQYRDRLRSALSRVLQR